MIPMSIYIEKTLISAWKPISQTISIVLEEQVDTNGAGDSFAIGFLTSYFIENKSVEKSIEFAQTLARCICAIKADSKDFPSKKELDERLEKTD